MFLAPCKASSFNQQGDTDCRGIQTMDFMTIAETAGKWGLSKRRVQTLCTEGRIPGATRLGTMWAIPKNAEKPNDARIKSGNYVGVSAKYSKQRSEK